MNAVHIQTGDALLIVDVQNDFAQPDGALSVPDGMVVVPRLNRCIEHCIAADIPVLATRDWHPPDHCSFADQGGSWPPHCIADSPGAGFVPGLRLPPDTRVISKATERGQEAYSGFTGTGLAEMLRDRGVHRLLVGGLATDYCVLQTVLDALAEDFEVLLLSDAVRAVEVNPGDGDKAMEQMIRAGAQVITTDRVRCDV